MKAKGKHSLDARSTQQAKNLQGGGRGKLHNALAWVFSLALVFSFLPTSTFAALADSITADDELQAPAVTEEAAADDQEAAEEEKQEPAAPEAVEQDVPDEPASADKGKSAPAKSTHKAQSRKAAETGSGGTGTDFRLSNYTLLLKGDEIVDGETAVDNGDKLSLAFDWQIVNNSAGSDNTYKAKIDLGTPQNYKFVVPEDAGKDDRGVAIVSQGKLTEGEDVLANYVFSEDGAFVVTLVDEGLVRSNIKGGVVASAVVDIDGIDKLPNGSGVELVFGDITKMPVLDTQETYSLDKQAGAVQVGDDHLFIEYTVTVDCQGVFKNATVSDKLSNGVLDVDSLKIEPPVPAAAVSIAEGSEEFTINLGESASRAAAAKYVITYRSYVKDGALKSNSNLTVSNKATLSIENSSGDTATYNKSTSTKVTAPSIRKEGKALSRYKAGDNGPARWIPVQSQKAYGNQGLAYNSKSLYKYPVLYTVTLDEGNAIETLQQDTTLKFTDTLLETNTMDWSDAQDWVFNNPNGPNSVAVYYALQGIEDMNAVSESDAAERVLKYLELQNGSTLNDIYLYGEKDNNGLTAKRLLQAIANTKKLFGLGDNPALSNKDTAGEFKVGDLTQVNGKYQLEYLVWVPSDSDNVNTVQNQIEVSVGGYDTEAKATTKFQFPPGNPLVKGAASLDPNSVTQQGPVQYKDGSGTDGHKYIYSVTQPEGEGIEYVDYAVSFSFDDVVYGYDEFGNLKKDKNSAAINALSSLEQIVITDLVNGAYVVNPQTGELVESPGASSLSGFEDVVVEIYRGSQPDKPGIYVPAEHAEALTAFKEAEAAFLDYANEYGWISDSEHKEGYDQSTLISLYGAYSAASNAYLKTGGLVGSLSSQELEKYGMLSVQQGQLVLKVSQSDLAKIAGMTIYTPVKTEQHIGGSSSVSSFQAFAGNNYYLVLRYKAPVSASSAGSQLKASNAAKVDYIGSDGNPAAQYPPNYVNTQTNIEVPKPVDPNGSVSVSKSAGPKSNAPADKAFHDVDKGILGWTIQVDTRNAQENIPVKLADLLPDGLSAAGVDEENLVVYTSENASAKDVTTLDAASGLYTAAMEDGNPVFTIPNPKADGLERYVFFYFKTKVDAGVYLANAGGKLTFKNTVSPSYNDKPLPTKTSQTTIAVPALIDKTSYIGDSAEAAALPGPIVDPITGAVSAKYKIDINPEGADLDPAKDTIAVVDTMTDKMTLREGSVKAVAVGADGEQDVDCVTSAEGNVVTFTVPDETHVRITYAVDFDVQISDLGWTSAAVSGNSAVVKIGDGSTTEPAEENFANFSLNFGVWIKGQSANIVLEKYYLDGTEKKGLAGALFELSPVYDNKGNTYKNTDGTAQGVSQVTSEASPKLVSGLKLDRVYKLQEIEAPDGFVTDGEPKYFALIGDDGEDLVDKAAKALQIDKEAIEVVQSGDTISVENQVKPQVTSVKVSKVDVADGTELDGAHIQILDKDGNVVEEWDSVAGTPHEVLGLNTQEEYTLRETVAPEGYGITTDTVFVLDEDGKVDTSKTSTTVRDDGTLLVEDSKVSDITEETTPTTAGEGDDDEGTTVEDEDTPTSGASGSKSSSKDSSKDSSSTAEVEDDDTPLGAVQTGDVLLGGAMSVLAVAILAGALALAARRRREF